MQAAPGKLSRDDWTKLMLGLAVFFGLAVRIFPPLLAGFPINDGGMFMVMIRELRNNGFMLPALTSYNLSAIPFAYPPLGMYVAALLSALGLPELKVLAWMPAIVNAASIPAFYLLARLFMKDKAGAAAAAMIYALVPGNYAWQIMGGGVTRSFGVLFMIVADYSVLQMFRRPEWKYVWLSVLLCSLAVLSHPEVALATASSGVLFWAFYGRNRAGILRASITALGVLLLTSPWWGSVLAASGLSPFLSVVHSGAYIANPVRGLILNIFKLDLWTGLFHLLFLAGAAWNLYRRRFFLVIWMLLPYFVEPRSAPAPAYFPQSIMAAQALMEALPLIFQRLKGNALSEPYADLVNRPAFQFGTLGLALLWFLQSGFFGYVLINTSLNPSASLDVMSWVHQHVPEDGRFLILTGKKGVMTDPIQEWFPALAGRRSQSTLQGLEWTLGPDFFPRLEALAALQECREAACLEAWSARTGLPYGYVLLEKNAKSAHLLRSLEDDPAYARGFENSVYVVFARGDIIP